jgi:integrase
MKRSSSIPAAEVPDLARRDSLERTWFLRGSAWDDIVWNFAPTNLLEEERPWRIRWDFILPSGRRFTDPHYAPLLQTAKQFVALIRTHSLPSNRGHRASTAAKYFMHLRGLLQWMDAEDLGRFADLDSAALLRFQRSITQREGRIGAQIAPTTVQEYLSVLVYLYHFRDELDDALSIDPCRGQTAGKLAGVRRCDLHHGPYTPDTIAIPLIQGAIEFLENSALDILRAREVYATAFAGAQRRGRSLGTCNNTAKRALQKLTTHTLRGTPWIHSIPDLDELLDMLYAACFVVISYLVGPRGSELLHLRAGCVQSRSAHDSGRETELAMIVGTIFKQEVDYYGRPHEWVAPPAAVHAITVLEALSAPHRLSSGDNHLWLRARGQVRCRGANEWQRNSAGPLQIPTTPTIAYLLRRFGKWLNLPLHQGKPWRLSTHQGRKTFARFTALRDRTSLFALAHHLGHRDRAATDQGYAGNDHALDREIASELLDQSVSAWEHMLSVPELGGRAGGEILAKRPQFRGARMKEDLKTYARMLVEAGLILGVCDWGLCVYRQEYSACRGSAAGPNPVYREPSTCARCKNFVVSTQHRPYWREQVRRCEALLHEPALPTQTLKIVRERLAAARATLRAIDSSAKEADHGQKTSH